MLYFIQYTWKGKLCTPRGQRIYFLDKIIFLSVNIFIALANSVEANIRN